MPPRSTGKMFFSYAQDADFFQSTQDVKLFTDPSAVSSYLAQAGITGVTLFCFTLLQTPTWIAKNTALSETETYRTFNNSGLDLRSLVSDLFPMGESSKTPDTSNVRDFYAIEEPAPGTQLILFDDLKTLRDYYSHSPRSFYLIRVTDPDKSLTYMPSINAGAGAGAGVTAYIPAYYVITPNHRELPRVVASSNTAASLVALKYQALFASILEAETIDFDECYQALRALMVAYSKTGSPDRIQFGDLWKTLAPNSSDSSATTIIDKIIASTLPDANKDLLFASFGELVELLLQESGVEKVRELFRTDANLDVYKAFIIRQNNPAVVFMVLSYRLFLVNEGDTSWDACADLLFDYIDKQLQDPVRYHALCAAQRPGRSLSVVLRNKQVAITKALSAKRDDQPITTAKTFNQKYRNDIRTLNNIPHIIAALTHSRLQGHHAIEVLTEKDLGNVCLLQRAFNDLEPPQLQALFHWLGRIISSTEVIWRMLFEHKFRFEDEDIPIIAYFGHIKRITRRTGFFRNTLKEEADFTFYSNLIQILWRHNNDDATVRCIQKYLTQFYFHIPRSLIQERHEVTIGMVIAQNGTQESVVSLMNLLLELLDDDRMTQIVFEYLKRTTKHFIDGINASVGRYLLLNQNNEASVLAYLRVVEKLIDKNISPEEIWAHTLAKVGVVYRLEILKSDTALKAWFVLLQKLLDKGLNPQNIIPPFIGQLACKPQKHLYIPHELQEASFCSDETRQVYETLVNQLTEVIDASFSVPKIPEADLFGLHPKLMLALLTQTQQPLEEIEDTLKHPHFAKVQENLVAVILKETDPVKRDGYLKAALDSVTKLGRFFWRPSAQYPKPSLDAGPLLLLRLNTVFGQLQEGAGGQTTTFFAGAGAGATETPQAQGDALNGIGAIHEL